MSAMHRRRVHRLREVVDSFWGACLGAGVYAAWAVWANWDAGSHIALRAGLTHWAMSTFLTYTGTGTMRQLHRLGRGPDAAALLCFCGGLLYTYALLIGAHAWVGTAHIALTLAAGVIPTLLFCGSYALLLSRTQPLASHARAISDRALCP
ncbi:MAG: hypothetical protein Q8Q73_07040 [Stagnimonas sp.]|nr:hypothetical protein [Stagnimonas sp.]